MACLAQGTIPAAGGQIGREIAYMLRRYRLRPAVLLAYDRTAYTELEPSPNRLRITIDRDIRSRQTIWTCAWGRRANRCSRPACV